jgi:predicted phage tail protein
MLTNIATNIGLALVSALFAPKAKQAESTRENDAFGSLVNSTNSGTPVALHYGLVRVAGQLISGYISTVKHAKNEQVNVYGEITQVNS